MPLTTFLIALAAPPRLSYYGEIGIVYKGTP